MAVIFDFGFAIFDWGFRFVRASESEVAMTDTNGQSKIKNQKSKIRSHAFTLVEMLTVIGIIVLLVSILLPVVSAVRSKGHAAKTQAILQSIAAGIQSYYGDFNAYPGPLHNSQVRGSAGGMLGSIQLNKVTMSENLTLGLLGGLYNLNGTIGYDPLLVGSGPMGLNPRNPKKGKAYMDKVNLSPFDSTAQRYLDYKDEVADADDTEIPEFLDGFPDGMPILYLRAKQGAPVTGTPSVVVTNTANYTDQGQYDLSQVIGYTGTNIGVGKDQDAKKDYQPAVSPPERPAFHGFRTADPTRTVNQGNNRPPGDGTSYVYPYDLNAYMRHPTLAGAGRQQDGYFLISGGADRIYGTKDDITFPAGR